MSYFVSDHNDIYKIIGWLNSNLFRAVGKSVNPREQYQAGELVKLPSSIAEISNISQSCIAISKEDWDAHETSWDFETNELIKLDKAEAENIIRNRPVELAPEVAEEYRHTEKLRVRMELYMENGGLNSNNSMLMRKNLTVNLLNYTDFKMN